MSKYRAIVFDIDGTAILNQRHAMPSERLKRAIATARSHLHLFAASGRGVTYGRPILQALGVKDPCIVSGGTTIIDPTTGEIIEQALLSTELISLVQQAAAPFGYDVHLGSTPEAIRPPTHGRPVTQPQPYILLQQVADQDITGLLQALSHLPEIVAASSPDFEGGHTIQITNHDATKEHRVRQILETLGVSRTEAIGVGDGDNDIHLFAAVGHRVAMGNASEQLKSIADEIAPPVSADGLTQIIEQYS
jgi:hydroxymethylpyrimidine pyrophosphatase-like HAD family hydrolase